MKCTGFIVALCLSYLSVSGQQPSFYPQTHEVGIQYGSLHHIPEISEYYKDSPVSTNYVNGLQYKYHWDLNNVIRASASRRTTDIEAPEGINRFSSYSAQKDDWDIRLGYEANLPIGPWVLFAGVEGIYGQGTVTDNGTLENNDQFEGEYTYKNLGLGGLAGIRLFFTQHLSTTLEGNIYFTDINYDSPGDNIFRILPEKEMGFAIRGYLSIHFVKLKKRCACY